MAPFANGLASFHHLGAVAGAHLVVDGGAPCYWGKLLSVKLNVVHLEISLGRLALHEAGTHGASVRHALREYADVGNCKIRGHLLGLGGSYIVDVLSVGVVILLELHLVWWRLPSSVNVRKVLVASRILLDVEVILVLAVPLVALWSRYLIRETNLAIFLIILNLWGTISI